MEYSGLNQCRTVSEGEMEETTDVDVPSSSFEHRDKFVEIDVDENIKTKVDSSFCIRSPLGSSCVNTLNANNLPADSSITDDGVFLTTSHSDIFKPETQHNDTIGANEYITTSHGKLIDFHQQKTSIDETDELSESISSMNEHISSESVKSGNQTPKGAFLRHSHGEGFDFVDDTTDDIIVFGNLSNEGLIPISNEIEVIPINHLAEKAAQVDDRKNIWRVPMGDWQTKSSGLGIDHHTIQSTPVFDMSHTRSSSITPISPPQYDDVFVSLAKRQGSLSGVLSHLHSSTASARVLPSSPLVNSTSNVRASRAWSGNRLSSTADHTRHLNAVADKTRKYERSVLFLKYIQIF